MEQVWNTINQLNISGIPVGKISAVIVVLTLTQVLRRFFVGVIIAAVERLTRKTESTLDDELIIVIKPCLSWLIQLGGFWLIKKIIAAELGPELSNTIGYLLNMIAVFLVAYVVYRGSYILGEALAGIVLRTGTELDELLKPLMPKIFQSAAVIVFGIKVSEIFLGQSAGALVGLLGGAGITFGLLLKDVVYDWFCTLLVYSDKLYREGDWVSISGVDGFVEIIDVGFRSTTLHLYNWGSIVKMPNSRMISGIVENWSQNPGDELKWGVNLTLKIDGISAQQTSRICDAIKELRNSFVGLSPEFMVRFSRIEGNARVIQILGFVTDASLYNHIEKGLNLGILEILEKEGIDNLCVQLETSPKEFRDYLQSAKN